MFSRKHLQIIFLGFFFSTLITFQVFAEPAFDFGLPLFGHEEVRFEKSKAPDFNFQLLKKYVTEHQGSVLHQLHAISRWFSLIKLSDTPRKLQLVNLSSKLFSTRKMKEKSVEERLREVFFRGLLLSTDKVTNGSNAEDERFEELLLECEPVLIGNPDYSIIKGILFHLLRNRPNNYFAPMKPEEDLKQALASIPKTAHYYYAIGQAFRFLGTMDSSLFLSIASYEKAASLAPRNPKLQNALLSIYMGLHEDFQAKNKSEPFWLEEAVYKKILTLSPNNPYALNNLGYLYSEYGVNAKLAQELCQKAVDVSPDNAGFRDSLGWAAFKNKDYKKAEEEFKKSLSMRENVYDPNYHIATLYYSTNKREKAEEYYRKAIEIKPDSAEALNNLAYLLAESNKKIEDAMSMAETAVKLEPSNASYLDTLGWLYYRMEQFDKALDILLKSAQIAPGQGEILMHIGTVYLEKGDFSTALDYLKQAYKAEPNLNETGNALYLALRLKAYYSSLSEYHSIMGEKANKDRICNILMGIARLYQEEKLYEKAIEVTRICADVKNGAINLSEPILNFYKLPNTSKKGKIDPEQETNQEQDSILPDELPSFTGEESSSTGSQEGEDEESLERVPVNNGYPLVLSIGPDFFNLTKSYVPSFEYLEGFSITLFISNAFKPAKNLQVRIESETIPGTNLLQLASNYFSQLNATITETDMADSLKFELGSKTIFAIADRNALYFYPNIMPDDVSIDLMSKIVPHANETFASIFYDWREFQKQIPSLLKPFIQNPLAPFVSSVSRYSTDKGVLNEFSILTTGKPEDSAFLRKIARKLLEFKIYTKSLGMDATIKVRGEGDTLYLSTDIEGFNEFIDTKLSSITKQLLLRTLNIYLSGYRCFASRMFFNSATANICPENGEIDSDGIAGIVSCSIHQKSPVIPFFLDESEACQFSRNRLQKVIEANKKIFKDRINDESLLNQLIKEYIIPLCPTSGSWKLEKDGKISCSDHEN